MDQGWTITIEAAGTEPADLDAGIQALVDALADRGGAVSGAPDGTRYGATFSATQAFDSIEDLAGWAERYFGDTAAHVGLPPWPIVRLELMTFAEHDAELERPNFPELIGVTEIAELAGVTRQRASKLAQSHGFPAAVAQLASGPVWTRPSLDRFLEEWQRKPGRPSAHITAGDLVDLAMPVCFKLLHPWRAEGSSKLLPADAIFTAHEVKHLLDGFVEITIDDGQRIQLADADAGIKLVEEHVSA